MKERRGEEETGRRGEKESALVRPVRTSPRYPIAPSPDPLKEGEDFYREGACVVFTARYHLKRGYCCESGCRHCPYRGEAEGRAVELEKEAGRER